MRFQSVVATASRTRSAHCLACPRVVPGSSTAISASAALPSAAGVGDAELARRATAATSRSTSCGFAVLAASAEGATSSSTRASRVSPVLAPTRVSSRRRNARRLNRSGLSSAGVSAGQMLWPAVASALLSAPGTVLMPAGSPAGAVTG